MLFSLAMFPIGSSDSLVDPVAEVIEEIETAGLPHEVTGMNTIIEGDWEEVMPVIRRAHLRLREKHDRVHVVLSIDDHRGVEGRLRGAVRDVEEKLGREPG